VPITAVCPECQNHFRLHEAMAGKTMRCTVCQEVFVVRPAPPGGSTPLEPAERPPATDTPPRSRTDAPPVVSRTGNVTDFVPLVTDVTPAAPARSAPPTAAAPPERPRQTQWSDELRPPPAAPLFPWEEGPGSGGKKRPAELQWTPGMKVPDRKPAPPPAPPVELEVLSPDDHGPEPQPRDDRDPIESARSARKKRRNTFILAVLSVVALVGLGTGAFFLVRYINLAPERLHAAARADYEAGNYKPAQDKFDEFLREYPSHELAPEARFFGRLSSLRLAVTAPISREDPRAAMTAWGEFIEVLKDPEVGQFAQPDRFNLDVYQAGARLLEDVVGKAKAAFNPDTPDETETWLSHAAALEPAVEGFRPNGLPKAEGPSREIATLRTQIDTARRRLAALAEIEQKMAGGSDEDMELARKLAVARGLVNDPGFRDRFEKRERAVQEKAVYVKGKDPIRPVPVPDDGLTSLLFAPRFDKAETRPLTGPPTVFFCLARGVLYALDEAGGNVLWAARTGLDTDVMPVRVPVSDQHAELVLIASNTGDRFGVTARLARNGQPLWHHPLAAPCKGPPVAIGPHAYVSLGDPDGTVLEIALSTGEIVGRIVANRPLGPSLAGRPGTTLLYVPADARAVYVFDVNRTDPDGRRLDPIKVGVVNTGHGPGTLRGVPVFSTPDPNDPGPKFLVLGEAAGFETMKLRAFRLPDAPDAPPQGDGATREISLPGWASFPPHCDGEKLAVVTDKGQFGLYGLALAGNPDQDLFAFPTTPAFGKGPQPSRGQVVLAEEGAFWVLAAGRLHKLRFGVNPTEGVRMVPYGDPIPVGEPLHAPQVNAGGDTFVVVTQEGMVCRATAVDARTGDVRWRRDLGLITKGDPMRIGNDVLFLDHAGGFYKVDTKPLADRAGAAWLVDEGWMLYQPARGFVAQTGLIRAPGDTAIAVLAGEGENAGKVLIRKYRGGNIEERTMPLPAPLAGQPVASGPFLLLPLANGTLYRYAIDGGTVLEDGPSWRAERLPATAVCYLAPINDDELFATDGAKHLVRWQWSSRDKAFVKNGQLELSERPAATPVVLDGTPLRVVVADSKGHITMWNGEELKPPPFRAWRPGTGKSTLPVGPVADGLRLEKDPAGEVRIAYTVAGRPVWLSPDAEAPKWVGPEPLKAIEGRPVLDGNRVLLTDRAGVVRVIDTSTGRLTGPEFRLSGSHAFAAAAVPLGADRVLVPLADGTVVLGDLKKPAEPAGAEKAHP
jgi:outer membrane protein assembly factor BamB